MSLSLKNPIPPGFEPAEDEHPAGRLYVKTEEGTDGEKKVVAAFAYIHGQCVRYRCPGQHVKDGTRIPCGHDVTLALWAAARASSEDGGAEKIVVCPCCENQNKTSRGPERGAKGWDKSPAGKLEAATKANAPAEADREKQTITAADVGTMDLLEPDAEE